MKKNLSIFIFVAFFITTSCIRVDDDTIRLNGTWLISSDMTEWNPPDGGHSGAPRKSLDDCTRKEKMVFTDTELTIYSYEKLSDGSCSETISTSPYTVSDGKLNFSVLNQKVSFELDFRSTSFKLKTPAGEDIEGYEYDRKIVRTFEKQ